MPMFKDWFETTPLTDFELPRLVWWLVVAGAILAILDRFVPWTQRLQRWLAMPLIRYFRRRNGSWPVKLSVLQYEVRPSSSDGPTAELHAKLQFTPRSSEEPELGRLWLCYQDGTETPIDPEPVKPAPYETGNLWEEGKQMTGSFSRRLRFHLWFDPMIHRHVRLMLDAGGEICRSTQIDLMKGRAENPNA